MHLKEKSINGSLTNLPEQYLKNLVIAILTFKISFSSMAFTRYFVSLSLIFSQLTLMAQNNKIGIGVGTGLIQSYGDVNNALNIQPVVKADLEFSLNKRFNTNIEFHTGKLVNGIFILKNETNPKDVRYFVTSVTGLSAAITYNFFSQKKDAGFWTNSLHSFYAGAGLGIDNRKVISIRTDATLKNGLQYRFATDSETKLLLSVPVVGGINFYIPKSNLAVGLTGQLHVFPGDELDGYTTNVNGQPDLFAIGGISLKYFFPKESPFNTNRGL